LTFKDLKKRVSLDTTQHHSKLFERLLNKPFWIWDQQQHRQEDIGTKGDCCFNHIIGLSQKDGIDKPLYDYEKMIFNSLVSSPFLCLCPCDTQNGNDKEEGNIILML
jgi:hypothetical protein